MAEVNLTVQALNRTTGADHTTNKTTCASGSNYHVANDGNTRLVMAAASASTVTIVTPNAVDANAIADLAITLADTKVKVFGPFPISIYGSDLVLSVSANTDVTAIRG
jgi:hypothetical protein